MRVPFTPNLEGYATKFGGDEALVLHRVDSGHLVSTGCEDRLGTGPPQVRTKVIDVDLGARGSSVQTGDAF